MKKFMRLAIEEARKNLKKADGGPFGAVIVKNGKVLAIARNTVLVSDATAHAEVNAIRIAAKKLGDFDLSGCRIYSTTEPCPMCFSAIHWARIDALIYGTAIRDVKALGFNELALSCKKMKKIGKSKMQIICGFLRDECLRLLKDWDSLPDKRIY
ncbi:MAG: nucleoside deaminase [Candidatus Omnitrophica bacterium]|nr:nucleoside deaminase [Candidatus Omnitrophota bacterium]